jgi:hypothetical protein
MTPSARLLKRLRRMGLPIPEGSEIRRTYAGFWQRRGGAWSWTVWPSAGIEGVGSTYRVTELASAARLAALKSGSDWHVYAVAPGETPRPDDYGHRTEGSR